MKAQSSRSLNDLAAGLTTCLRSIRGLHPSAQYQSVASYVAETHGKEWVRTAEASDPYSWTNCFLEEAVISLNNADIVALLLHCGCSPWREANCYGEFLHGPTVFTLALCTASLEVVAAFLPYTDHIIDTTFREIVEHLKQFRSVVVSADKLDLLLTHFGSWLFLEALEGHEYAAEDMQEVLVSHRWKHSRRRAWAYAVYRRCVLL